MNSQKNKGDKAEREAAELLSERLPWKVRRKLGAGRMDDVGDLEINGCPECVIQVADWADKSKACLQKPREVEMQRWNAKARCRLGLRYHRHLGHTLPGECDTAWMVARQTVFPRF